MKGKHEKPMNATVEVKPKTQEEVKIAEEEIERQKRKTMRILSDLKEKYNIADSDVTGNENQLFIKLQKADGSFPTIGLDKFDGKMFLADGKSYYFYEILEARIKAAKESNTSFSDVMDKLYQERKKKEEENNKIAKDKKS